MIEIKITLNENKSKKIKDYISTDVVATINIEKIRPTRSEIQTCEEIESRLNLNSRCEIIDHTKEQKFSNLQDEIDKFIEFLEKHKDISLD